MNLLAYVIAGTGGLLGLLIHLLVILIIFALVWWVLTVIPLPPPVRQIVTVIFVIICAIILIGFLLGLGGCAKDQPLTPQQQAGIQTAENLAQIAVEAAATYYGGPQGAALASAGLDAGAAVLQGYIGGTVPTAVLKASPGVKGVGAVLVQEIAPTHIVKQSDVDKINAAAAIAATLKPAIITPTQSP